MEIVDEEKQSKKTDNQNLGQDVLDTLLEKELSEEETINYKRKENLINSNNFVEIRKLEKDPIYLFPEENRNKIINKQIIIKVLLPKLKETYDCFLEKGGSIELDNLRENSYSYLKGVLNSGKADNKKLRKCARIARGEAFLFRANKKENENEGKYICLEVQKNNTNIDLLKDSEYFVRRHIYQDSNILLMSDILLRGKKFLDQYLSDKKIKYVISSSWLFDDDFNDFWMKERFKEDPNLPIPNRIKIRKESLNYGGIFPPEMPEESIEDRFLNGDDNSMTRAIKKYKEQGNKLKEGGGYIDLEKLERWKSNCTELEIAQNQ